MLAVTTVNETSTGWTSPVHLCAHQRPVDPDGRVQPVRRVSHWWATRRWLSPTVSGDSLLHSIHCGVVAEAKTPATTHTATPSPRETATSCSEREEKPRCPGAEIGKAYPFALYTHCGIRSADFDGRRWIADPILGSANPPPGWGNPADKGSMELVSEDRARFYQHQGPSGRVPAIGRGGRLPLGTMYVAWFR